MEVDLIATGLIAVGGIVLAYRSYAMAKRIERLELVQIGHETEMRIMSARCHSHGKQLAEIEDSKRSSWVNTFVPAAPGTLDTGTGTGYSICTSSTEDKPKDERKLRERKPKRAKQAE